MAITESTIRLIFDGSAKGVTSAAAATRAALKGLDDDTNRVTKTSEKLDKVFTGLVKGLATLGAAGAAVQVIGGVAGAVAQLAPAALLVPGAALAAAAAVGTFKLATAGLGDALKAGLSGDMKKFAEATKDMAPAMQDAIKAIVSFKPQLDDLRKTVQTKFWDQFSVGLKNLGNNLLPVLQKSLPQLSQELGNIAKQAVNMLGQPAAINDIREVLDNTTETLRGMRPALANVLSGFLGIAAVGATHLPQLGKAIGDVTAKFKAWVDSAVESGKIDDLINGAIQGFKDLAAIVGNVGSIIGSVFTGLGGQISSPLAALRDLTGQLADFLKTAEAQDGLRALGDVLATAASVMRDVLLTALQQLAPLLVDLAPAAKAAAEAIGGFLVEGLKVVGPLLQDFAVFASANPVLVKALTTAVLGLAVAFKVLKTALAVQKLIAGVSAALGVMGTSAGVAATKVGGAGLVGALGRLGALLKGGAIAVALFAAAEGVDSINQKAADGRPLQGFEANLHNIVGAGEELVKAFTSGDLSAIFSDIGDEWDTLVQKFQTGESPIGATWQAISSGASSFLDMLSALPGQAGAALSGLGASIASTAAGAWDSLVTTAQTAVTSVVSFVTGLPGMVGAALSSLGATITSVATTAWQTLVTACVTAVDAAVAFVTALPGRVAFALGFLAGTIVSVATTAWQSLVTACVTAVDATVAFVTGLPARVGAALSVLGTTLSSVATSAWSAFTSAVIAGATAAVNWVRSVPGMIGSALSALASTLASVATSAWNAFTGALQSAWNATISFVRSVPGQIVGALSSLAGQLASSATAAGNSFTNGLRNAMNAAIAFVRGIPGAIVGALGNLGGLLVSAGASLINGLTAGMRSALNSALSFVRSMAAQIAAGFRAAMGIASPSKVFEKIGGQLGAGLVAGLQGSTKDIIAQATALGTAAAGGVAGTPLALSAPNPNAGVLQQLLSLQSSAAPIQVTVLLDGQPVRDIARTEVATSNRATRRTVGMGAGTTF